MCSLTEYAKALDLVQSQRAEAGTLYALNNGAPVAQTFGDLDEAIAYAKRLSHTVYIHNTVDKRVVKIVG